LEDTGFHSATSGEEEEEGGEARKAHHLENLCVCVCVCVFFAMGVKQVVVALFVCTSVVIWTLLLWAVCVFKNLWIGNKMLYGSSRAVHIANSIVWSGKYVPFGSSQAVMSGLLAVLTVNLILAGYVFLALRAKPAPNLSLDPPFLLLSRPAEVSSIIKPPGNSVKAPIESFSTNLPEP
jgi:hypothetical protein